MTLPPGLDPDDVINRNPEEWRQYVSAAESVVAYVIRVLTAGRDLNIGAGYDQVALGEWIPQALSGPQKIHDSAERLR